MAESKVLVLNRCFSPIHITSLKRAICMIYMDVAKIVDENFQTFDFESWSELSVAKDESGLGLVDKIIKVPRVIVLQVYDKLPRNTVKLSRHNIFVRDQNTCQYCAKVYPKSELNLDHVVPRVKGGVTSWKNIVCSCIKCNLKKGGRTPSEAGMKLLKQPKAPNWKESLFFSMRKKVYAEWKPFLNVVDYSYWNTELEQT
ncbi:HNH endonuclease [bacterium]|nr:HNH endonuclease [bacterium]